MSGHIAAPRDSVTRKKAVYKNRYGLSIAGEPDHVKDTDLTRKHPALIVGAPYGGVKEQGPRVYGNELAQRGLVLLTFDPSFMGESGGLPPPERVLSGHLYGEFQRRRSRQHG